MPVSSLRAVLRRAEQERERRGRRGGRALPSFDAAGLRGRVLGERGLRRVVPRGRQHHRRLHLLLEGKTNNKHFVPLLFQRLIYHRIMVQFG